MRVSGWHTASRTSLQRGTTMTTNHNAPAYQQHAATARQQLLRVLAGNLTPTTLAAVVADLMAAKTTSPSDSQAASLTAQALYKQLETLVGYEEAVLMVAGNEGGDLADASDEYLAAEAVAPGSSRLLRRELSPALAARANRCNHDEAEDPLPRD